MRRLAGLAAAGACQTTISDLFHETTGFLLIDALLAGDWEVFRDAVNHLVPAGQHARLFVDGLYHPHDAQLHAGSVEPGICGHRAG